MHSTNRFHEFAYYVPNSMSAGDTAVNQARVPALSECTLRRVTRKLTYKLGHLFQGSEGEVEQQEQLQGAGTLGVTALGSFEKWHLKENLKESED